MRLFFYKEKYILKISLKRLWGKKKKEKYNQRINTLKHIIEWGI